jgi:hypothetical protein
VLKEILGLSRLKNFESVESIHLFIRPGQQVKAFSQSSEKIGYILLSHKNEEELIRMKSFIKTTIKYVFDQPSSGS